MNKQKNNYLKWFTIVELIVVILVLAILWTIAFVSLQWYSKDARDSTRLTDLKTISKTLELYKIRDGVYPLPENWTEITFSWAEVWTQGIFWEQTRKDLSRYAIISTAPKDPLTLNHFTYSVLNTRTEYELWAILEWWIVKFIPISTTYAWEDLATAYIKWDYNWLVAKVSTWTTNYVLAVPSIINSDLSVKSYETIVLNKSLVYNWYKNLPSSYSWTTYNTLWESNLNLVSTWNIVVYNGTISSLSDINNLKTLSQNLQLVYSWTLMSAIPDIQRILLIDTNNRQDINNVAWEIVNKYLWWNVEFSTDIGSFNCDYGYTWNWTNCIKTIFTKTELDNITSSFLWDWWLINNPTSLSIPNLWENISVLITKDISWATKFWNIKYINNSWLLTASIINETEPPVNLQLSHVSWKNTFSISWVAGVWNWECIIQYNKNWIWTDISWGIFDCDSNIINIPVTLPGDWWIDSDWNNITIRLTDTNNNISLWTFSTSLTCSNIWPWPSDPTLDRDCDWNWNNQVTYYSCSTVSWCASWYNCVSWADYRIRMPIWWDTSRCWEFLRSWYKCSTSWNYSTYAAWRDWCSSFTSIKNYQQSVTNDSRCSHTECIDDTFG